MNEVIKINEAQLAEVRVLLGEIPNMVERVQMRALNKTVAGVRTDISTALRAVVNARKSKVDEQIKVVKATMATNYAVVSVKGGTLPLSEYSPTQKPAGVSAKVYKQKPRVLYQGAFIAVMKSGHKGVFKRTGPGRTHVGHYVRIQWPKIFPGKHPARFPIKEMYGPRLASILEIPGVMNPVLENSSVRLANNVKHEMEYELGKLV